MIKKLFERFRKKKSCGEPSETPQVKNNKAPSACAKKVKTRKEKDLIKWK